MDKKLVIMSLAGLVLTFVLLGCAVKPYGAGSADSNRELDIIKELQDIEGQLDTDADDAADIDQATEGTAEDGETAVEASEDTSQLQRIEVQETETVSLNVDTIDLDKDNVTYTFSAPLDSEGIWRTNYGDAGEYAVTVTVNDGVNKVDQKVLVVVLRKNAAPVISNLPEKLTVREGETVSLKPVVTDPNSDEIALIYSAPFDADGSWTTDHTSAGEYEVTVMAEDGETQTESKLLLTVTDVNVPPAISGLESEIEANEGDIVDITPEVADLDGDSIAVSISEPIGDDGKWETTFTNHGTYIATVTASDGKDTVSFEVTIKINDVNVPPKIVSISQG